MGDFEENASCNLEKVDLRTGFAVAAVDKAIGEKVCASCREVEAKADENCTHEDWSSCSWVNKNRSTYLPSHRALNGTAG